jgi:GrpB-like predicted nucleotidyltransferase (UPF0157 family)
MESLQEKIARVLKDKIEVVPYDPAWPEMFEQEKKHLLECLPNELIIRIEHYGSTSVPGLAAKPVVDMLIEVTSLEDIKKRVVPILESQRYDYFWRPTRGDDVPPFYAWFIKRDAEGRRTHHLHMIESHFEQWKALHFRDYLRTHPESVIEYQNLKLKLSQQYPDDRIAYTEAKTGFILKVTEAAMTNAR